MKWGVEKKRYPGGPGGKLSVECMGQRSGLHRNDWLLVLIEVPRSKSKVTGGAGLQEEGGATGEGWGRERSLVVTATHAVQGGAQGRGAGGRDACHGRQEENPGIQGG